MLSAERITKSFRAPTGRVVAVDCASLALEPGARLGLVGPSGSGKSTLAQVMAMLLEPDSGSVTIDGDRVDVWGVRCSRELRHRVQLVFQAPRMAVDPRLRLGDAILEPLAASSILPAGADERAELLHGWAARVGLTGDLLERFPHEVSEGQLQRACLARARRAAALSHLRRAVLDARRLHPGRAAGDDRRDPSRARARRAAHHPRPRASRQMVRRDSGHPRALGARHARASAGASCSQTCLALALRFLAAFDRKVACDCFT
jgi:ABC-type lipoprotein export system ATPase subunit